MELYCKPYLHPNGFIQVWLNDRGTKRLHVWPDAPLPKQLTDNPIHDHVFDMTSSIVLGSIQNDLYLFEASWEDADYLLHHAVNVDSMNTILQPTEVTGKVTLLSSKVYEKNYSYTVPAGVFHATTWYGLAATIMEKKPASEHRPHPRVLCPIEQKPDNSFRRDAVDPEILIKFVNRVMANLTQEFYL